MDFNEFHDKLLELVPYTDHMDKPFKKRLGLCLSAYKHLVTKLDELPNDKVKIERNIDDICEHIERAVDSSLRGLPSTAFRRINHLLVKYQKYPPKIDIKRLIKKVDGGTSFYRVRRMTLPYGVKCKELFHIPITSRGIVKSFRYSSPGYPCLYLSNSIYGCWEEMRRPPMFQCAVSRLESKQTLNFIDLTIPTADQMKGDRFYLELVPLIMACMIKVADEKALSKPEYIVPQLLIEWILKFRRNKDLTGVDIVHGVKYHSTQMNKDFEFPMDKMENYAIPVFSVDPQKQYCPTLCAAFSLTKPTNNEVEQLKEKYGVNFGILTTDNETEQKKEQNYDFSNFGQLETRLKEKDKFSLWNISYKNGEESLETEG